MNIIFDFFKKKKYLLVIFACVIFWALLALIRDSFNLYGIDSDSFYNAGKSIFSDVESVYTEGFYYLPIFAVLYSFISMFPFWLSEWILFFILLLFSFLSIITFDKILTLKSIENPFRFLFLFISFNGHTWFIQFDLLNVKIIVLFLFLLFLKREIDVKNKENERGIRFLIMQLLILNLIISMLPYFFFLVIIYVFHEVHIKEVFKLHQIKKYCIFLSVFFLLNFSVFLNPKLFIYFLNGLEFGEYSFLNYDSLTPQAIIEEDILFRTNFFLWVELILGFKINTSLLSIVLLSIVTVALLILKDLTLEKKIGYFILASLLINVFVRMSLHVVSLPLILLLLLTDGEKLNSMKLDKNLIKDPLFISFSITCFSIMSLMFLPDVEFLYRTFSFLQIIPFKVLILTWTILYIILAISLYFFINVKAKIKEKEN